MRKKRPHWLDKPEFAWTPEPPLHPEAPIPGEASLEQEAAAREAGIRPSPAPWSAHQSLCVPPWLHRIALALGQDLLLLILLLGHDRNWWPDNGASAGLTMALLLAPLLAVQGLGRMAPRVLLAWSLGAAILLFGLGFYQHWRATGVDAGSSGLWLAAMAGAMLFIGQSLLLAHASSRPLTYGALHKASWGLTAQLAICGFCAAVLWGIWRKFPVSGPADLIVMTLVVALVAQHLDQAALRSAQAGLALALTVILPALILVSIVLILLWSLTRWLPSFALSVAMGVLMIASINASYGDGRWRSMWRRRLEFAGALLLLPLATLCVLALQSRITALGFTAPRVVAAALVLLLLAYGATYTGAALISLTGGRALERLETGNRVMAFMVMSLLAAMITPLADPVRLAVAEQTWRLTHGAAAKFDYAYLRNSGLRFGHDALGRLARPALVKSRQP